MHEVKNTPGLVEASEVHPAAVVHSDAELGPGVKIGPFAVVGPSVKLGRGVHIHAHAVVDGDTTLGEHAEVFPHAAIGLRPQDLKYDGSKTKLIIGARTVLREGVTVQPGSTGEGCGVTQVGSDCLVMAYSHIAHDCVVGDRVVVANGTQIAGHCVIGDRAILGGVTTVHQFVRVGAYAITGASSRVLQDIPPFVMADGHPARLFGLNSIGLRRAGFSDEARRALKRAYRQLFLNGAYREALAELEQTSSSDQVRFLCRFLRGTQRGITRASQKAELGVSPDGSV